MARLLDRNPAGQRMFLDTDEDRAHSLRRRRRLTFLSLWRQLALVAPTAAIVLSYAIGSGYVVAAGKWMADVWNKLPPEREEREPATSPQRVRPVLVGVEEHPLAGWVPVEEPGHGDQELLVVLPVGCHGPRGTPGGPDRVARDLRQRLLREHAVGCEDPDGRRVLGSPEVVRTQVRPELEHVAVQPVVAELRRRVGNAIRGWRRRG